MPPEQSSHPGGGGGHGHGCRGLHMRRCLRAGEERRGGAGVCGWVIGLQ